MKVVINRCFGGFGQSDEAFEMLLHRKGIVFEKQQAKSKLAGTFYYAAGHLGDEEHYICKYEIVQDRSDKDLIAVIAQLGDAANSEYAQLALTEVPDDVEWEIVEYDGMEHISEIHRTWR